MYTQRRIQISFQLSLNVVVGCCEQSEIKAKSQTKPNAYFCQQAFVLSQHEAFSTQVIFNIDSSQRTRLNNPPDIFIKFNHLLQSKILLV